MFSGNMFGVGIGICIGALFILTTDPIQAIWFVVFMVCLQQIEGNFIFPRVVGSNMGLPPLIMVSAITLFANFFGVVGLLVSGPVTSVVYTLVKRFVAVRIKERNIPPEKYEPVIESPEINEKKFKNHTTKVHPPITPVNQSKTAKKKQPEKYKKS